jgi:hypothetical protein
MPASAHGLIEIEVVMSEAAGNSQVMAAQEAKARASSKRILDFERQMMATAALEKKRYIAEGSEQEERAVDRIITKLQKANEYRRIGFTPEKAGRMASKDVEYESQIAARQKAVELAKNIETSQASLNAQKLRELETAKQIAEKQASIASSNAKEQAAMQKKIQLMAAVASGDKQREQHLRAMATLERNVQAGLNAGMKPSEALQQARTMLRLEQSISQEKQKQVAVGGGPGGAAYAGARRGSAFAGGQNAAYRVGMLSQQAQDVAVSLQMGMSASRVIAQQGSQIASIFGEKGMIIGGVIAIGAAMWEFASNTAAAEKKATELAERLKRIEGIQDGIRKNEISVAVSRATMEKGGFYGELESKNLEYQDKQRILLREMAKENEKKAKAMGDAKEETPFMDLARDLFTVSGQDAYRKNRIAAISEEAQANNKATRDQLESNTKIAEQDAAEFFAKKTRASQQEVREKKLASIISDARAKEQTDADRYYTEDLEREQEFYNERNKIRDSDFSDAQKNAQYAALADARAAKDDEVAASRQRKREEEAAAVYLKDAEKQVKLTEEKAKSEKEASQFRDTGVQKYQRTQKEISDLEKDYNLSELERTAKLSAKKLEFLKQEEGAIKEIEAMRNEGVEFAKAGLAGTEAQNKRKVIEMEMDLLNKKKAFSPIEAQQIANKLELLRREQVNENFNMGAMGAGGMGAFNRNRKAQERAQDMAERRALENMGLIGIQKGVGGEIIAGTDPVTGRKLTKDELAKRKADMAAEKMRRDMERKAAAGDKEAQERLKRVRWGNEGGNDGKIAAGFSEDQIKFLSTSIADAVKELIAK